LSSIGLTASIIAGFVAGISIITAFAIFSLSFKTQANSSNNVFNGYNVTEYAMIIDAEQSSGAKAFLNRYPDANVSVVNCCLRGLSDIGTPAVHFLKSVHWITYFSNSGYPLNESSPLYYNNSAIPQPPNSRIEKMASELSLLVHVNQSNGKPDKVWLECGVEADDSGISVLQSASDFQHMTESVIVNTIEKDRCIP
jgi:hypothetical protein